MQCDTHTAPSHQRTELAQHAIAREYIGIATCHDEVTCFDGLLRRSHGSIGEKAGECGLPQELAPAAASAAASASGPVHEAYRASEAGRSSGRL